MPALSNNDGTVPGGTEPITNIATTHFTSCITLYNKTDHPADGLFLILKYSPYIYYLISSRIAASALESGVIL